MCVADAVTTVKAGGSNLICVFVEIKVTQVGALLSVTVAYTLLQITLQHESVSNTRFLFIFLV